MINLSSFYHKEEEKTTKPLKHSGVFLLSSSPLRKRELVRYRLSQASGRDINYVRLRQNLCTLGGEDENFQLDAEKT